MCMDVCVIPSGRRYLIHEWSHQIQPQPVTMRLAATYERAGLQRVNLYKSIVGHRLPPSRPINPWRSCHWPCAESMSGLGCNRKEKRGKKGRVGREEKKLLTKKKKKKVGVGVGGGEDGVRGRFMGDVYYYTALPQGGEGRGVGRESQNILFSPSSSLPIQKPHRGWRALSQQRRRQGKLFFLRFNVEFSRDREDQIGRHFKALPQLKCCPPHALRKVDKTSCSH